MDLPKQFETNRTVNRKFALNYLDAYWDLIQNNRERLTRDFPITVKNTFDVISTEQWLRQKIRNWDARKSFAFLIFEKENDTLLGQFTVKSIDWDVPKAELAYFIDKLWAGKGITTEVVKGGTQFCFDHLKLSKVYIRAAPENKGSRRIAEKCGFKKEGLLKKDHRQSDGSLSDVIYYGLLAPEA